MPKKNFKDTFLNIQNEHNEDILNNEEDEQTNKGIQETEISPDDTVSKIIINQDVEQEPKKSEIVKTEETTIIHKDSNNEVTILTTKEIQVDETLNDRIQRRVVEIEKEIKKMKRIGFGTGKKKMGFDDMYGGKTISMNRYLKPLFDEICDTSSMTRAEIIENILINGIKNTNFNPPEDDDE